VSYKKLYAISKECSAIKIIVVMTVIGGNIISGATGILILPVLTEN
jgi:hypothetical protein